MKEMDILYADQIPCDIGKCLESSKLSVSVKENEIDAKSLSYTFAKFFFLLLFTQSNKQWCNMYIKL